MKLRLENGKCIVIHNGKVKEFDILLGGIDYCFEMVPFEKQIAPPHQVYPVRSLVPHPKKRRVTKKWREKINSIKHNFKIGVYGK
jgi:hypothetical protein